VQYLLDTNMLSDLVRRPEGLVTQNVRRIGQENVVTSIIVAAGVRYGVTKRGSDRLAKQAEAVLSRFGILNVQPPVDQVYARLRVQLESAGQPIGPNDLLIASQALAYDLIVVTNNVREFSRVEGLQVENWLENEDPR
jgi:tRNA(fMet)-specific endonuclease VapC